MAFAKKVAPVPVVVGTLTITTVLEVVVTRDAQQQAVFTPQPAESSFAFDLLAADGTATDSQRGNLRPHITQAQVNSIQALMTALRTQAHAQTINGG